MNDATLNHLRAMADAMEPAPKDWEWIGRHMSQRMFGITEKRARDYAARPWRRSPPNGGGDEMNFEDALKLVRAAGYRVTKPKPRKLSRRGPPAWCALPMARCAA